MSRCSPFVIELSEADRRELDRCVRCYTGAHARVVRARIVLLAAEGIANVEIARRLGVCVDIVSRWRKRFREEGLAGLEDRPRSGRPRVFAATVVAQVKAMACEAPRRPRPAPVTVELVGAGHPGRERGAGRSAGRLYGSALAQ